MADRQFSVGGVEAAPAAWLIPAALEIIPKLAYAKFDGSLSAGAYVPCLRIVSNSGHVAMEAVASDTIAAGASVDASWFRGVGKAGGSSTGGFGPDVLFDQTLVSTQANFDTGPNGIAQTNRDLLIVTYLRTSEAIAVREDGAIQLNADNTATHYKSHRVQLQGSTLTGLTTFTNSGMNCLVVCGSSADAGAYAVSYQYVPNYTASVQHAAVGVTGGIGTFATTGNWWLYLTSCRHNQAAPVTQVTVIPNAGGGGQFVAGSRCTIYGLG